MSQGATSGSDTRTGRFGLGFPNPGPITAIEAGVIVTRASFEDCVDNPTTSRTRAQIIGAFFNDGSSTGSSSSDRTGDIRAGIQKHLSHTGNQIAAFINRCSDAGCSSRCSSSTTLTSFTFTTAWTPGQAHTLRLEWDAAGNRFLFTVNPGRRTEEATTLTYTQSDSRGPVLDFKELLAQNTAPSG